MNRRGFLGALARTPVVTAISGRAIAEKAAAGLSGITSLATGEASGGPSVGGCTIGAGGDVLKTAMRNLVLRSQVESIIYEQEHYISRIDPDLAVLRSLSLSAKVTFQRQRNVARQLDAYENGWHWDRLSKFLEKLGNPLSLFASRK